jgi:hypothetical protein
LAVGYRRYRPAPRVVQTRAGVDSCPTTFQSISRKAKGTHHIAIRPALPVHITDILLAGAARETELETDTITFQDIALAQ